MPITSRAHRVLGNSTTGPLVVFVLAFVVLLFAGRDKVVSRHDVVSAPAAVTLLSKGLARKQGLKAKGEASRCTPALVSLAVPSPPAASLASTPGKPIYPPRAPCLPLHCACQRRLASPSLLTLASIYVITCRVTLVSPSSRLWHIHYNVYYTLRYHAYLTYTTHSPRFDIYIYI